jgi:two-component system sensor histidine kinase KdpD
MTTSAISQRHTGRDVSGLRTGLEFVAGIAHDLKTPLATIATSAELLEQDVDGTTSSHLIKVIQRQAERINLMILELSEHVRAQSNDLSLNYQYFDLGDLIDDAVADVRRSVTSHEIALHLPDEPIRIFGDQGKLRRVVDNLLRNASLYSVPASLIMVNATPDPEANEVLIKVEDEGPGIPAAMRTRIFDPFVRLEDRPDQGQGLGLQIVKLLSEAHGGHAWVEPSPLGGSCFCVALPLLPDRED